MISSKRVRLHVEMIKRQDNTPLFSIFRRKEFERHPKGEESQFSGACIQCLPLNCCGASQLQTQQFTLHPPGTTLGAIILEINLRNFSRKIWHLNLVPFSTFVFRQFYIVKYLIFALTFVCMMQLSGNCECEVSVIRLFLLS